MSLLDRFDGGGEADDAWYTGTGDWYQMAVQLTWGGLIRTVTHLPLPPRHALWLSSFCNQVLLNVRWTRLDGQDEVVWSAF
jgi:hypothetical protein